MGAFLLRHRAQPERRLGFALIFANFPINRLFFVLIYANDEYYAAYHLLGGSEPVHLATIAVTWAIGLPPLVIAYRAITNRLRPLWFTAFFILPFIFIFVFAGLFLEEYLLLQKGFLASGVIGIPLLLFVIEGVSLALFYAYRADLMKSPRGGSRGRQPT